MEKNRKKGNILIAKLPTWAELLLVLAIFAVVYGFASGKIPSYIDKLMNMLKFGLGAG